MASARRTYDTDSIYLRRIFVRDANNYKISTNYILVANSNGEGQWTDSAQLVLSAGYYYLSTAIASLSNYVFTPMQYKSDTNGNINEVDFLTNVQMNNNLNVNGLTTLGSALNVNNSIRGNSLNITGETILENAEIISGGRANGFGSIDQLFLNSGTNNVNALGYDSLNNAYVRTVNTLNFYNGQSQITANLTPITFSIGPDLVRSYKNVDIVGNLSFTSISTGAMSLYWLSSGTAAIDTLNAKVIGGSTISTSFLNADSISTNRLWANEYNIDQFNFKTLSAGGFYAGTISSGAIFSKTISAGTIAADSISVGKLYFDTLNVSSLQANSISTNELFLNSISTGFITAGTISTQKLVINNLSTETFYSPLANIGITGGNLVDVSTVVGKIISTGFLQVPFISTLYGEFGLVSSMNYIGPLTSTQVVEASSGNIGVLRSESTLVNYLSAGTAVFSQITLPVASVGVLSTGLAVTGLGIFGAISSVNMSVNNAYINNVTFGNYAFLGATLYADLKVSSLNVSSISTAKITVPLLHATNISSGTIKSGIIQASNLEAVVGNISTLFFSTGYAENMFCQVYEGQAVSTVSVEANTISSLAVYTHTLNTDIINVSNYNTDNFAANNLYANNLSTGKGYIQNLSTGVLNVDQISCGKFISRVNGTNLLFTTGQFTGNLFTTNISNSGSISNVGKINTYNLECSNILTIPTTGQLNVVGTLNASNTNTSLFNSSVHNAIYANNGYIRNLSFTNANFENITINSGNFTNITAVTARIGSNMCVGISTGILAAGIINTSTINTYTFATNTFAALLLAASTISVGTFQLKTLSVGSAYIDILSVGTEVVGSGNFQEINTGTLYVQSNLGVATTTPVTTLDVNGSLNVGSKWRFFLGLGENTVNGGATIKTSSDGKSWTDSVNTFTTAGNCAVWTGKQWIAGGAGTSVLKYSGDGINWNDALTNYNEIVNTITEINNTNKFYVAAGELTPNKSNIVISQDGKSWSYPTRNTLDFLIIKKIAQRPTDGQILIAGSIGDGENYGETIFYGDSNSINEADISLNTNGNTFRQLANDIIWANNQWIAIGEYNSPWTSTIIKSQNGLNWDGVTGDFTDEFTKGKCLAYNGQIILAGAYVNTGSNSIKYSYDGSNWSNATGTLSPYTKSLTWNGTQWIAGISSIETTSCLYSDDGIVWSSNGFTNTFSKITNAAVWSGNSNFPVSSVINGPLEVLSINAELDVNVGSNLTYGLSLRNASTVWATANNYLSNIENYSYTKNDVLTPTVYLGVPRYSADSFENIVYASANLTISSLVGSNILSSGIYTNFYNVIESNVTKLAWIPVPGNSLWKVVY